jgi:hypothetical protein
VKEADEPSTRESGSRELAPAPPEAPANEFVLPAQAPQTAAREIGSAREERDALALLRAPNAREVLRRLVQGDPLRVEERVRARIDALALLVEFEPVVQATMANIAYFAARYRGRPEFESWMAQRVEAGIERVLENEAELDRTQRSFDTPTELHVRIGGALGMNPRLVRPALVVFNSLPLRVRRVFQAVVVERRALDSLPLERFGPLEVRERRLRAALESISTLRPVGVQVDDGGLDEE